MAGKTLQSTIEIAGSLSPSLQQAIKQAVDRLEEMSQETLESAGAAAKLAAEINTQESVLRNLQRGYEDYIVSGSESTDEALRLADTIQDLSNELNENRGALEAAHEAAQKLAGGQQETADAYSKLQKQIGEQEAELATLRRSYANVALEQGETSAEARQLASQISQLSGDLNENRQRLSTAEQAADQLGNSLEDAGQDAESSSEGYTVLKNVLANLVTEGINKAVDAFKELATEGDTSLAMLSARTGATAQELEGFEDVMYEVYNSNYGDSLGDVSEKLSTVIQMTDNLDKGCTTTLLVLTERLSRREITRRMEAKKAENVVAELDALEKRYGELFPLIFKSITVDNGSEFANCEGMERSSLREGEKRTKLYYCHPYSAYERGSNENQNKLVRRHAPKGSSFEDMTDERADYIEGWMNDYPRKMFNWHTPEEVFQAEIKALSGAL